MALHDVFGTLEKPVEEKKLEVVVSEEAVLDELLAYFEQNKYEGWKGTFQECNDYLDSCLQYLQTFKVTPKIVSSFYKKFGKAKEGSEALGVYLSAMIQTSYDQGFNNFEFGKIHAHCFGSFLQGQKGRQIQIKVGTIKGPFALVYAKYCSLDVETIIGVQSLSNAENCVAEITNYTGDLFGSCMENCKVYLPNPETFLRLSEQANGENNHFFLGKITDKSEGAEK
ncbi:hypothetical protein HY643_04255 [Candidatus Woesearchaeota archaeon]|nr:hypothetical protein [Candidatus Woesearchaeota archaeon]